MKERKKNENVPEQLNPLPTNPDLQEQEKLPGVYVQIP